ncbi:MAG: phosphatidate cytidylyltransferase [Thermodesulfobacteriota bacterium]
MKRLLAGLFLIPLTVFATLYAPLFLFASAVSIIAALSIFEFNRMVFKKREAIVDAAAIILAASMPFLFFYSGGLAVPWLVFSVFFFFVLRLASGADVSGTVSWVAIRSVSLLYLAVPFSHMVLLLGLYKGRYWLLFAFAIVWANDTCAYFTGRLIGRRPLSPVISPKKTVEGALGGIIGGVTVAFILNKVFSLGLGIIEGAALSVILGAVSILGDLVESMIKRDAGVKDSGTLIPGHGGVLDRLDSLVFTVPVLYYYLLWRGVFIFT